MNYQERNKHFQQTADLLKKRYNLLSLGRLLFFILAIAAGIFLAQTHWSFTLSWALLASALFLWMVRRHLRVQEAEQHHRLLAEVNQQEQEALAHRFAAFPDGSQYKDPLHPYASDLDLFGHYSLFQFCNRTVTVAGSNQLAQWLSGSAAPATVRARQLAVAELGPKLDWRQHFRAYGLTQNDEVQYPQSLQEWVRTPSFVYGNLRLRWALVLLPIWALVCRKYA
jgi:hypothetical protein